MTSEKHTFSKISIIIPALNAQDTIVQLINSIDPLRLAVDTEVLVVDHSSTDNTAKLAAENGCIVVEKTGGNVSSVRNFGVKHSTGDLLIFLDADVVLTNSWHENIGEYLLALSKESKMIVGSHCSSPVDGNWIERYWFDQYANEQEATSLGTGHMIMTRTFFDQLQGFDEDLVTGEDYDLCARAKKKRGEIVNAHLLRVVHYGYPQSATAFIKREQWHGIGDVTSVQKILSSKVALSALIFLALHAVLFFALIRISIPLTILAVTLLLAFLIACSYYKYRRTSLKIIAVNTVVFYLYFIGRAMSFKYFVLNQRRTEKESQCFYKGD